MTPTRKPCGWVFCPMVVFFSALLVELDVDVADALGDAGGAPHGARTPAPHEAVGRLVDGRPGDEELVDVGPGAERVRDGALDELLDDRGARLRRELKELDRFGRALAADEVDDHARFPRSDPREPRTGLALHRRCLLPAKRKR